MKSIPWENMGGESQKISHGGRKDMKREKKKNGGEYPNFRELTRKLNQQEEPKRALFLLLCSKPLGDRRKDGGKKL